MPSTFHQLPKYTLQQLSGRVWQIAKDGKPISISSKENCLEYLNKWAYRGEFTTLPPRKN